MCIFHYIVFISIICIRTYWWNIASC